MGSWSRLLVTADTVEGNASTIGYSIFKAGLVAADLSHSLEELAFVVSGRGLTRREDDELGGRAGQAPFIPARIWHPVLNDSGEDLGMVFSFPFPHYPATEPPQPR